MPPYMSESSVLLTEEALCSLNRNKDEDSKSLSSKISSDASESGTSGAESRSIDAYDSEQRNALEDRDICFAGTRILRRTSMSYGKRCCCSGRVLDSTTSKESLSTAYQCEQQDQAVIMRGDSSLWC